MVNEYTERIN